MSISRAKSLESLYEECKLFDLVIVPDAPLASALNRRLDQPHFGSFAITPRRLAARRREQAEDRLAFLAVIEQTDLKWKEASYVVGNILQCWEYRGSIDAILEYEAFATPATRTAVNCIAELDTTSRRLTEYTIDDEANVVVVGIEQLTELERSILPAEYETIDPFTDDAFAHPPFRVYDSPAAIVETVVNTVTSENADQIGVVLDGSSEYSSLVESALEAANLPYYGGPGFTDEQHHRAVLQLLRSAHAGRDTRVSDVNALFTQLEMPVAIDHAEKCVFDVDNEAADWLLEFSESIDTHTFETALDTYESVTDTNLVAFRDELERLGILDEPITESAVDRLEFYLQTYEVPIDRENEGVLLADAKSAGHVDRPVVFYLGLDEGWTHSSPSRPWVDSDREFERNIRQFQRLLQNGVDQYYLVQDSAGGRPVTPCLYFEELFDTEFDRFSDLSSTSYTRRSHGTQATQRGFENESMDVDPRPIDAMSQSSLSTYVNCPRDYFFNRLLDNPDRDYFVEGNLFHDFAEFYVAHPDHIDVADLEVIADVILEEVDPFLRGVEREIRRTRYRIGLETIVEFLEENPPRGEAFVTADGGWGRNFFAEYYDRPVETPHTELWFENTDLRLKGKIDLVHDRTHLLDYKSGSKKSARSVVKNAAIEPPSETPNFQALLYLTHQRSEHPGETLQFTFFHFLETLDEAIIGDPDLEDCLTTVTYHPISFEEHISSPELFEELQHEAAKKCQKTFSQATYDDYSSVFETQEFPSTRDSAELIDSAFGEALTAQMKAVVGDYKYVEKGCVQALRHLIRIRNRNYFSDDLDAFERFVLERLEELNDCCAGTERFPVDGLAGEPNYRYVDHRDCVLEGETR
ncbi:PD-(D/E)XK nuclease family protein [Natrialbaceae archaeon A-CW3]